MADIFNTLRFDSSDAGSGFATVTRFKPESRTGYLGFTYRFGHGQEPRKSRSTDDEGSGGD